MDSSVFLCHFPTLKFSNWWMLRAFCSFVVSQDLDLGLKEWFGHIQLSFDGPQLPVYVAPLIPPTIHLSPFFTIQKRCKTTLLVHTARGGFIFIQPSVFSGENLRLAPQNSFGTNSVPRLFLQHSAADTEKHHTTVSPHEVWVLQGPDDNAHNARWHRKRGGRRCEGR